MKKSNSSGSPVNHQSEHYVNGFQQEKKQAKRYVLTVLKDGEYEPLTNDEMD
jgi:hypothetical protein